MSGKFLIPLLAATFLAGPAFAPAPIAAGLSGSAQASIKLNSSRSNIYRTKKRMGGGGGHSGAARTTTVNNSKSNHFRMGGGGGHGSAKRSIKLNSSRSNIY